MASSAPRFIEVPKSAEPPLKGPTRPILIAGCCALADAAISASDAPTKLSTPDLLVLVNTA